MQCQSCVSPLQTHQVKGQRWQISVKMSIRGEALLANEELEISTSLEQVPHPIGVTPAVIRVEVPQHKLEVVWAVGNPHTHQLRNSKSAAGQSTLCRIG